MIRDVDLNFSSGIGETLTIFISPKLRNSLLIEESSDWNPRVEYPDMYGNVMMNFSFSQQARKKNTLGRRVLEGNWKKVLDTSGLIYKVACDSRLLACVFVSLSLECHCMDNTQPAEPAGVPRTSFTMRWSSSQKPPC